jgi:hypothetical protein
MSSITLEHPHSPSSPPAVSTDTHIRLAQDDAAIIHDGLRSRIRALSISPIASKRRRSQTSPSPVREKRLRLLSREAISTQRHLLDRLRRYQVCYRFPFTPLSHLLIICLQ